MILTLTVYTSESIPLYCGAVKSLFPAKAPQNLSIQMVPLCSCSREALNKESPHRHGGKGSQGSRIMSKPIPLTQRQK